MEDPPPCCGQAAVCDHLVSYFVVFCFAKTTRSGKLRTATLGLACQIALATLELSARSDADDEK